LDKKIDLAKADHKLRQKIGTLSGEKINLCDQCGTCSGSCPMAMEMDINPSEIMKMVQMGMNQILNSKAIWLCASCYTCEIRCPRGLDLSKVAEALRQIKLRQAIDHIDIKRLPVNELMTLPPIALISACRKFTG